MPPQRSSTFQLTAILTPIPGQSNHCAMPALGGFRSYSGRLEEDRIPGVSRPSISGEIVFTEREEGLTASPPFRIPCYVGRKTGEAIAPRLCLRFSRTLDR